MFLFAYFLVSFRLKNHQFKCAGFTMYTTCVIWLAFVPLYFGTGNHVPLRLTSMSVTISLSASVTVACLFSPKVSVWFPLNLLYELPNKFIIGIERSLFADYNFVEWAIEVVSPKQILRWFGVNA